MKKIIKRSMTTEDLKEALCDAREIKLTQLFGFVAVYVVFALLHLVVVVLSLMDGTWFFAPASLVAALCLGAAFVENETRKLFKDIDYAEPVIPKTYGRVECKNSPVIIVISGKRLCCRVANFVSLLGEALCLGLIAIIPWELAFSSSDLHFTDRQEIGTIAIVVIVFIYLAGRFFALASKKGADEKR